MEVTRTFDLLDLHRKEHRLECALAGKEKGVWVKYSSGEYHNRATLFSYGLMALGLKKGDRIATISNNRPEWNFADMGMSGCGVVHVPIYPTISTGEYEYILRHAEPRIILISDKLLYEKIFPICQEIDSIENVYTFNELKGAHHWTEIMDLGRENTGRFEKELEKIKTSVQPEDIVTLIYTSGTTGEPKGVMLTHKNLVSNFLAASRVHNLGRGCKVLSFLPLSHVYERMVNYHFQYMGMSIFYSENMATIVDNLQEVKPEIFNSVPRLLERVYDRILSKGKNLPPLQRGIFDWAVGLGLRFKLGRANSWWYHCKLFIADRLVFKKWREALGGNVKIIVSGGAALQPRLARIFWAAGIVVLEGYGLTETSPVIAVNNLASGEIMFGTVGPVMEKIEVKIAGDGEILCRGPNIMKGYYKRPDLTAEVLDQEGWFHTGDVGQFIQGKFLKITDRKKEMFKLSSGKYIAPQIVENKFKESLFIEQLMVIGENEKFASAIIAPNFGFLHNWASLHKINFKNNRELISNPLVIARYHQEAGKLNNQLAPHSQIKRFRLVEDEWSPHSGELSPTLKLKRRTIAKKYKDLINQIYPVRVPGAGDDDEPEEF